MRAELFLLNAKETNKTRKTKERLEDQLLQKGFGRDALFIALGGGVISDLIGFLASTYMRGVDLILIPTTLLAMVDAAIGGKNGVNTSLGKNLIGTFYLTKAIYIDPSYLSTLPRHEKLNGLAEILKYGLVADPKIWEMVEAKDWQQVIADLILPSIHAKTQIVEQDPLEKGLRRTLNFGHSVAHALELLSRYKMAHGQAVALGCLAESFLSCHLKLLSQESFGRIETLYKKLPFSLKLPRAFQKRSFLSALHLDKKAEKRTPRFVLIDAIGHACDFDGRYCCSVEPSDLNTLVNWLEQYA